MKLIYIWSFARDFVGKKYLMYVASVIMCVLSLLLLSVALFAYTATWYGKEQCDRLFAKGAEKTGVFRFDEDPSSSLYQDDWQAFMSEVNRAEEIYAAGVYMEGCYDFGGAEELVKLQMENDPAIHTGGIPSDYLVGYDVNNKKCFDLLHVEFQKGGYRDNEEGITYLYLGAVLSSVDVGTTYKDGDQTYVVAGILKRGAAIIAPEVMFRGSEILELDYSVCLDNMVLVNLDGIGLNWATFSVNDGYSVAEGMDAIREIAGKYGMEITGASCEGLLYMREVNNEQVVASTRNILIWLVLVIFIIMLCIQVSDAIERAGDFGIMYANGSSVRDISLIVFMENVRRVLVSFILWAVIAFLMSKTTIVPYYKRVYGIDERIIMDILASHILPVVAVFAIFYMCIMSVIPVIMVKRTQPVKLIGGYKV